MNSALRALDKALVDRDGADSPAAIVAAVPGRTGETSLILNGAERASDLS